MEQRQAHDQVRISERLFRGSRQAKYGAHEIWGHIDGCVFGEQ